MDIDHTVLIGAAVMLAIGILALFFLGRLSERAPQKSERGAGMDSTSANTAARGDALAEAEVYIAYGRNKQAIDILEAALESDPSRDDIRTRLFEIKLAK